ncbi:MAG: phage tail protein [[Ruminococcus] torques]
MQIFNDRKKRIGTLSGFKDRAITTTLDSGDKEMTFAYPASGALVGLLQEEYYIHTKTDEFVIKAVEKGEQFNKYTAVLNVEELEGTAFPYGFESDEQTIRACLEFAFEGTRWHVGTCTVTKKRTIDEQENITAWDVLQKCLSTYRCECIIDSINKTVNIYERIGSDKGCYFIEGINLRKISLKSDTYDFYTRIYPIGKDGITPEWLTGKDYIDNFQYSSKVKAYVWKDERYTNTTSLIEDATAKIEEMSRPYKAYTAEVVDLAKASEEYKDILSYGIGDTVTLVSKKTRTKEKQRIVKITEYPETPKKNTVEISNARKTFADIQKEATAAATEEAISIANSNTKKVLKDGYYTKSDVESHITAAKDEISLGVSQVYETKKTVSEKVAAAEKNANAATDEKLTEYSTTEEMKSAIDMKADEINLGVSKTYETKTSVSEKITAANKTAQDAANAAEKNANAATDEKLTEYSTTEEMKSAIDMKADEINLGVSKTYETKTSVSEKITAANKTAQDAANAAEKNANAATDEKLTEYSTTTEMNAAIKVKADAINSTVSKKVGSNEIISKINQSAESVSINASKISLNGAVTANSNFKINRDGSAETKALKITGGSLLIGGNCEITNDGNVFALSPKFYSGLYLNSDLKIGTLSKLNYSMLMGYVGKHIFVGESGGTLWGYGFTANNNIFAYGTIGCMGEKTRIIHTDDGRNIEMYAYETASPTFGDMGTGKLDEDGQCYVYLGDDFLLTVERDMKYIVMLTAKGAGELYVESTNEKDGYFVVKGTPKLEFYWEVKTRQKGSRDTRIEQSDIPEKEDITAEEQEMLNEQMRNQMMLLYEMEKDEIEVQEEQNRIIERMEESE